MERVTVIGGGLAGSEAAWQLLQAGLAVELVEARPAVQSPAHQSLLLGELVCSNSLRSADPQTASGLLKQEMSLVGSLIMEAANATRVPAGSALAVDRTAFSWRLTRSLLLHHRFRLRRGALDALPSDPAVLATGPLTSTALSRSLAGLVGREGLYFYDAIAPIVDGTTIDEGRVFRGARRDPTCQDYINCPLDRRQYDHFVEALLLADQVPPHPFEEPRYFEGCLPVEVMAGRGYEVLAHGPLRPVGLQDPRSASRPHAVIQLRTEDESGQSYNMVGFQTRLLQREQRRVFRLIPGLERARFLRYGSVHRNSFLDAPRLLGPRLQLLAARHVKVAGQISGVEGYLESTAVGLVAGLLLAAELKGQTLEPPPRTTALGALITHVTRPRGEGERFEPSNVTFGLLPPPQQKIKKRRERREHICQRALEHLQSWMEGVKRVRDP